MRRLLAINWEMPPLSGPRAVQVTRTLVHLVPYGWASTVICFGPRSRRYNQDYVVDVEAMGAGNIDVVHVRSPEERLFFRALWRVCPPVKSLPDEKWVWMPAALREARRQLAARPFDALVSFGQPWSDHLIGLRLHRESSLPWVAHFSDPWTESPYLRGHKWQRAIWARMERAVVREATHLVFLNRQTAERTLAKYPAAWAAKVTVIPQGFETVSSETGSSETPATSAPATDRPLRIVYTGRFYPGLRTPDSVLHALARLTLARLATARPLAGRLTVDFFGEPSTDSARLASTLGLDGIVTFHRRVTPSAALDASRAADVLLVIDAPGEGPSLFLPSKLVDYLPLGKPILGVTPTDGASADLLRPLGYPIVDPRDIDGIAQTFGDLLDSWLSGGLTPSPSHFAVAAGFDIRETTRRFAAVLDKVLGAALDAAV